MSASPIAYNPPCAYPASYLTLRPIQVEIEGVVTSKSKCASFYLDTLDGQSGARGLFPRNGESHHQGLARTHQLSDGSICFFLVKGVHGLL